MTRLITLATALTAFAGLAHASPPPEIIKSLAERPMGFVVDDTCHVRGAVWAGGPRAGVNVALIDVVSADVFTATTDEHGAYALELPYTNPAVYQERLVDPVVVPVALREQVRLTEGGVVCDHRLTLSLNNAQEAL